MDAFAALADPVRRDLLGRLARGPGRVVDLAADHVISRPAISRHLRVLGEAGLVSVDDRGRERHYRLESSGLAPVTDWLAALLPPAPRFEESTTRPPARSPTRRQHDPDREDTQGHRPPPGP